MAPWAAASHNRDGGSILFPPEMFVPHNPRKRLCHTASCDRGGCVEQLESSPHPSLLQSLDWRKVHAPMPLRRRASAGESVGECGMWGGVGVNSGTTLDTQPAFPCASAGGVGRRAMRRARHSKYFSSRRQLCLSTVTVQKHLPGPRSRTTDITTPKCRKKRPPVSCPLATPLRPVSLSPPRLYKTAQLSGADADRGCLPPRCHCWSLRGTWPFPMRLANSLTMRRV